MDSYDDRAEYHEVYMPAAWDGLRDVVRDTFGGIGPDGVIVDIGAGSGLGTTTLAEVTDAELIALEPNRTMRSMMMARIDQAGLLGRVTVLPEGVPAGLGSLPDRVDGVIAAHMFAHLTDAQRTEFLEWIARSLAPRRSALITVSPEAAEVGHEPIIDERTVGRHVYRVTHRLAAPGRYEGLFEVIDDQQQVVRSLHDVAPWEIVTAADIRRALVDHPLEIAEPLPHVVVISHPR